MISPIPTVIIMSVLILMLGVVVPVLDNHPKLTHYVSLRWITVTVILSAFVGCLIDLSHLSESVRFAVVLGALIIAGVFIALRSIEKWKAKGMSFGVDNIKAEWGKAKVEVNIDSDSDSEDKRSHHKH